MRFLLGRHSYEPFSRIAERISECRPKERNALRSFGEERSVGPASLPHPLPDKAKSNRLIRVALGG